MITIGTDAELFLHNGKDFISSIDKFGGTKESPKPIGKGCAVQEDNVAVEFNIPPATNAKEFIDSINFALEEIGKEANKFNTRLLPVASAIFPEWELIDVRAKVFGCDPDFNAWTKRANPRPKSRNKNLRTTGGHIHVGGSGLDIWELGRAMDAFLGVPFLFIDDDYQRRELYGKAGAMRPKPYGMEYRVLSSKWLETDSLKGWVFKQTEKACEYISTKEGIEIVNYYGEEIQEAINNNNKQIAKSLEKVFSFGL